MTVDHPRASVEGALARLGISTQRALPLLHTLGIRDSDLADLHVGSVLDTLADTPNPGLALSALARLAERHRATWDAVAGGALLARVAGVAGASEALGDLLAAQPDLLAALDGELHPWSADDVRERATAALQAGQRAEALVRAQRGGLLRIAARDLLGLAGTRQSAGELAQLAQGVLAAALDAVAPRDVRIAIIGMGKLGGHELNYVSDVDVLFVHDGDLETAVRVCERFVRLVGETTPLGRSYELDANLRPEGKDGALSRTLQSYSAYYERWAKTWEFQALLKARPVAGDAELGRAFCDLIEPFVWPDRLDSAAVEDIQQMKTVVESSAVVRRAGARQVKLAPGGLRDIEFAVQLLQLVHGRHDPLLRRANTWEALDALAGGGYVGEDDAQLFSDAYTFLRTVEHRLQLVKLRRTHTLPERPAEREQLARSVGFAAAGKSTALECFDAELRRVQGLVREVHSKLFYRPLLTRFAELGADELLPTAGGQLAEEAARERLVALGFTNARAAISHLDTLASGLTRRARLFRTLLPAVLPTLASAPDPDTGLAALRALADRLGDSPAFLHTLRDNPPVADLLAQALGASRLVGQWLERQPDALAQLADLPALDRTLAPEEYCVLADGLLRRGQDASRTADALRRMRRRELVRTAIRDLSGRADVGDVTVELTGQAQACVEAALRLVVPDGLQFAVLGVGKLGGGELGYASDLDLLLVFTPPPALDQATRTAEQLLRTLSGITPEGQAFAVDLGLRPEGRDGPIVRSLDSYARYYQRWAEPWELLALTQARHVGGDERLGQAFMDAVTPLVYPAEPAPARLAAVRTMKARIERERAGKHGWAANRRQPAAAGERVDLKLGAGGLVDVEWTVQLLQLAHGGQHPELRVPGAGRGIVALCDLGLLSPTDAAWLRDGLRLLADVRNQLHLAGFRDSSIVPPGPLDQERLARMLGYARPGRQAFMEDLTRAMRRVRKVHERCFYDEPRGTQPTARG